MKNYSFLIVFVVLISTVFPQKPERYLVFFTDKGTQVNCAVTTNTVYSPEYSKKMYEDAPICEDYINVLESFGARIKHQLRWLNAVSVYMDGSLIKEIEKFSFVKNVQVVQKLRTSNLHQLQTSQRTFYSEAIPGSNTAAGTDKQLQLSEIDKAHALGFNGAGVILGILDTGFDLGHESLKHIPVIAEYDFIQNDKITKNQSGDASSQDQHGTYVLSVAAGHLPGVFKGAAPAVKVVLAKTENVGSETHVEEDNFARALEWMDSIGVQIASTSVGYNTFDNGQHSYTYKDMNGKTTIITKAVNIAIERGMTVFSTVGNEGNTPWHYLLAPADAYDVIAVGAVDKNNNLAGFSGRGPTADGRIKPEVSAMGVDVYGASSGTVSGYLHMSGTSSATPIAAGIGAITLSAFPFLPNTVLRSMILHGCANYPHANNDVGFGLLSAYRTIMQPAVVKRENTLSVFKISPESATDFNLHVSKGNGAYESFSPRVVGNMMEFVLPKEYGSGRADFFFTFKDSSSRAVRQPLTGVYFTNDWQFVRTASGDISNDLFSNWYPNPFSTSINADIAIPSEGKIDIVIYNVQGEAVFSKQAYMHSAGNYLFAWDGRNTNMQSVGSGVYLCVVQAAGKSKITKIMLLR